MANNSRQKIEPIFAWAEYEESHLADHPMPNDFSSPKGSEAPCANRKNSKKVNFPRNEPELIVESFDMEGDVSPPCKTFRHLNDCLNGADGKERRSHRHPFRPLKIKITILTIVKMCHVLPHTLVLPT